MAREAPPSAREAPPSGLSLRCCAVFHSTSRKWRVTFSMTGALPALCPPWTGWSPCGIQLWDRTRESPPSCLPATQGPVGPGAESCVPRPCPRFPGERWPVAAPWGCLPPGLHLPRGPPASTCAFCCPTCGAAREDRGGQKVELAFLEGRAEFPPPGILQVPASPRPCLQHGAQQARYRSLNYQ